MKLKVGQTIRIGFAFLAICAFWQMYNSVIPLILTNTFGMNKIFSGAIMAADNVLALFLLPVFGRWSDNCKSTMGRRKPFILWGTLLSVGAMMLIPVMDNSYFFHPETVKEIIFIVVLGILLVTMCSYRSSAVALMPDVTPKPLRSMGNAIINLMGAMGGVIYLGVAAVLYSDKTKSHVDYTLLFALVAGIMLVSLIIIVFTVNEVKLAGEVEVYEASNPQEELYEENGTGKMVLSKPVKRSLICLLLSIFLWFLGYNAVETWFTIYANKIWGMEIGSASGCLIVASLGAMISYIPIGYIASRIGRRRTILSGIALLFGGFLTIYISTLFLEGFSVMFYLVFLLVGMGWAAINVNSLPMVLEMCKGSEVGKYTGLYYSFSMAAQIATPVISGALMDYVDCKALFPYASITVLLSFVTMYLVKHGDTKAVAKKGLEAFDIED
ncbi:MAG: MFS transporter [Agathobacter sp.]|nr:MFS transporter [Agathobacter sp.]